MKKKKKKKLRSNLLYIMHIIANGIFSLLLIIPVNELELKGERFFIIRLYSLFSSGRSSF